MSKPFEGLKVLHRATFYLICKHDRIHPAGSGASNSPDFKLYISPEWANILINMWHQQHGLSHILLKSMCVRRISPPHTSDWGDSVCLHSGPSASVHQWQRHVWVSHSQTQPVKPESITICTLCFPRYAAVLKMGPTTFRRCSTPSRRV